MDTLDIVIVNKNSGRLLRRCLASIEHSAFEEAVLRSVVVVDNDSDDGSADGLGALLPITVIRLHQNIGFGAACNLAAKRCCSAFVLFLNPDICLPPHTIEQSLQAIKRENAALLGIRLADESGGSIRSRMSFPKARHLIAQGLGLSRLFGRAFSSHHCVDQGQSGPADCVLGAYLVLRRWDFTSAGGFDERFFLYFEEIDLARRLAATGMRCAYRADILAIHTGGCGESFLCPFRLEQSIRSRMLYARRYFEPLELLALNLATWILEPWLRALYALLCGKNPFAVLLAYGRAAFVRSGASRFGGIAGPRLSTP